MTKMTVFLDMLMQTLQMMKLTEKASLVTCLKFLEITFCGEHVNNTVSLSSAEAEYVALSSCVAESKSICYMLRELTQINFEPVKILEDNQSCIMMANTLETKRSKHIDIKYHFVREAIENGKIKLEYISTSNQKADILTKGLSITPFKKLRTKLGLSEIIEN